jgi:opacity protein-like surface antigen
MLRSILTLCLGVAAIPAAKSQNSSIYIEPNGFSLGTNFGMTDLWGDVGTKSILDHYTNGKYFKNPMFMGGVFVRYSAHPAFAVRMGVNYGTLYATDSWNEKGFEKSTSIKDDAYQRYVRNLNIKSNIWEGNLLMEITPFRFGVESNLAKKRFQPYLLVGVGAFHFKPTGEFQPRSGEGGSSWVKLNDLHLEGNGFNLAGAPERYELWQMSVPMGIGVRWDIGYQLSLGVEYLYRYCFFDYLDGASGTYTDPSYFEANLTPRNAAIAKDMADKSWLIDPSITHNAGDMRGNSAVNDAFSSFSISFFYKINRRADHWW